MPSSGATQPINIADLAGIGCVVMLIVPVDEVDKSLSRFPNVVHRFPARECLIQFVPRGMRGLLLACRIWEIPLARV